jgi:hypothetical protein
MMGGKNDEPVRHSAGERNRRKALHNAKCLLEELEFLHKEAVERMVNLKYAIHRACTLVNRLKAEARKRHGAD